MAPRLTTKAPDPDVVLPPTPERGMVLPCREDDPEAWFPDGRLAADDDYAATLCAGCPLLTECLRYAFASPQYGVWGGLSEATRWAMLRKSRRREGATQREVATSAEAVAS